MDRRGSSNSDRFVAVRNVAFSRFIGVGTFALAALSVDSAQAGEPPVDLALPGTKIELVRIAPGSFLEGSDRGVKGRKDDEEPRLVTLSRAYYLAKTETTVAQYRAFVTATGYRTEAEKGTSGGYGWENGKLVQKTEYTWKNPGFPQTDDAPVVLVTYADAEAFTAWASRTSAMTVRLPSEAEWEYAATDRGEHVNMDATRIASLGVLANKDGTKRTRSLAPNALGLFDMSGNAAEWCSDFYGARTAAGVTDPRVLENPSGEAIARRVLKGGSFRTGVAAGRPAARDRSSPGSRNADNGFRVLVDFEGASGGMDLGASTKARKDVPTPTPPEPVPLTPPPSHTSGGAGVLVAVLIPLAIFGVLGIALFGILRGRNRANHGNGMFTTLRKDGFLFTANMPADAQLEYQARVRGVIVTDRFLRGPAPGGTFVFTGTPPTDIQIRVLHPGTRNAAQSYRQQDGSTFESDVSRGILYGQSFHSNYSHGTHEHTHSHSHTHTHHEYTSSSSSDTSSQSSNWSPSAY